MSETSANRRTFEIFFVMLHSTCRERRPVSIYIFLILDAFIAGR